MRDSGREDGRGTAAEAEILPPGAPGGESARRVRAPGWIGRNRGLLEQARRMAASAAMVAPPPARITIAAGCLAIDGVLLAEEARTGGMDRATVSIRAAGLLLESGTLVASTRIAPGLLSRNGARIMLARRALARLERARGA
jgi:hypothetical protein